MVKQASEVKTTAIEVVKPTEVSGPAGSQRATLVLELDRSDRDHDTVVYPPQPASIVNHA